MEKINIRNTGISVRTLKGIVVLVLPEISQNPAGIGLQTLAHSDEVR